MQRTADHPPRPTTGATAGAARGMRAEGASDVLTKAARRKGQRSASSGGGWRATRRAAVVVCLPAVTFSASTARPPHPAHARTPHVAAAGRAGSELTQVAMRGVDFYVDPEVVLHVRQLRGTMRTKSGAGPILFDDKRSFVIHVVAGEVGLTGDDLSALLNKYVFAYRGSPLRDLRVQTTADGQIVMRGRLRKAVELPFTITSSLAVAPDGRIVVHPTRTVMLGLHVDGLTRGLGLTLDKLVDLRKARGASVRGNDILLDPDSILPPPAIEGRVTAVRVEGNEIVQQFGTAADAAALPPLRVPDPSARNYMYYEGGTLRFGKLEMHDAEMQIVDMSPEDPFKFDLDRYNAQLVAGYSQTLPDLGLEVHMRDIDKVGTPRVTAGDAARTHSVQR